MEQPARLLYCHCAYAKVVPQNVKDEVLRQLTASGTSFEAVADLCELSAKRDPALSEFASCGPLKIAACYPRAVKWLFHAAGSPLPAEGIEIINMREEDAAAVSQKLLGEPAAPGVTS